MNHFLLRKVPFGKTFKEKSKVKSLILFSNFNKISPLIPIGMIAGPQS
jgi:hypothetical protein